MRGVMKRDKSLVGLVSMALFFWGCTPSSTSTSKKAQSYKEHSDSSPAGNLASPYGKIVNPADQCESNTSGEAQYCQIFTQKAGGANTPLDILWVVDNSGSMRDEQQALAQNFEAFINKFAKQGLHADFRMAIITTDNPVNRVAKGKLTDESLTRDRNAFIRYFKEKINVGLNGKSDEKGLLTSEAFLKQNSDWPRNNAYIITIYVSDQDDTSCLEYSESTGYINRDLSDDTLATYRYKECDYVSYIAPDTTRFSADDTIRLVANYYFRSITNTIPQRNEYLFKAFAIIPKPQSNGVFGRDKGYKYHKLTEITGGHSYEISDSFEGILQDFGQNVARISSQFQLQYPAQENTVEVYVNGALAAQGDWSYLPTERAIRFEQNSLLPAGSTIKVVYRTQ